MEHGYKRAKGGDGRSLLNSYLLYIRNVVRGRSFTHTDRARQAEISALENSGRLPASAYRGATMYTTLSPCDMCTGSCILYKVARVVIGENETFMGGEKYLKERGIEVVVVKDTKCRELMQRFVKEQPDVW